MVVCQSPIESAQHYRPRTADAAATFLVRVGEELAKSLDYETTLQAVAHQAVPFLADVCWVQTVGADGRLRPLATAHVDGAKDVWLRDVAVASGTESTPMAVRALRRREPVLVLRLSDSLLRSMADEERLPVDPKTLAAVHEAGSHSSVNTPLIARGRALGVLGLARLEERTPLGLEDMPLIQQLARQCAQAVDNARLYQQATEAARARDEFLAATSHELRTPLSEIKGFVSTLLRSDVMWDEATRQDFLREIERDADRLDALISDLLDMSRLASGGHFHFQRSPTPPAVLVCGGLDRVRLHIAGSSVDIDSMLGKLPPVSVDGKRIEQVIANIVENASKYAPGSTIHIRGSLADGGKRLELVIEDDGPGISAEDLNHIFDRFYRGHLLVSSDMPGSGLGLAIARMVVEAHGGCIRAENRLEGGGARFVVSLPVAE